MIHLKSKILTQDIIESLPNMSVDLTYTDGEFEGLKYVGFCIIEVYNDIEETFKCYCGELKNFLTLQDISDLKQWSSCKDRIYVDNYYRMDFENYIYLFQNYEFERGKVLLGNLLEKDFESRLNLISLNQQYLKRLLNYGTEYRV